MPDDAMAESPYHEGERAVQQRAGERREAERSGRVVAGEIPAAALGFVSRQPMIVLGIRGPDGRVWASLLFGPPGFLEAPDRGRLTVDLDRALTHPADPFWRNVDRDDRDPRVGTLLIELDSRRRLRVNGRAKHRGGRLEIRVDRAYPNCPKYIQRRHVATLEAADRELPEPVRGEALTASQREWLSGSDTFFVASAHPGKGVDASHRGGDPGFVRVLDERTLRIPDYPGNSMFNTLGNFEVNPAAGLVFPDFEGDRVLQLAGTAEIRWDLDDPSGETGGTGRFWDFRVDETLQTALPLRSVWEFLDSSPHNP